MIRNVNVEVVAKRDVLFQDGVREFEASLSVKKKHVEWTDGGSLRNRIGVE